ncbi:ACP S-malonyltransferase [Streptomyces piniterrae]|uniref:Malonyl CoA-acyl carrier protein transacylase n=1 Tax=Streptomyces piniterrae TaxID=2571125 RepID=A0A4U0P8P2_9ACTN|nr:ACP S-malonyltransferase [Streptomyces piniterrae]TJZ59104.1 ACP S-malonyltransferase [Streptomyces piniterrae]
MTRIFMFPGQGAQHAGMGRELFGRFPELVREADDILGHSIRQLCLDDPDSRLGSTEYTQPAVYVVNALALRAARAEGSAPDVAIGHSLGEYNALEAAGVFGFAEGLRLVVARARAMARIAGGGMAAVLGLDDAVLRLVLRRAGLDAIQVANLNTSDQTVIAGPADGLAEAATLLLDAGARAVRRLDVSGPFHTSHMTSAAEEFAPALRSLTLAAPAFPVIANRTARPYPETGIADLLIGQIDHPVLWRKTVEALDTPDAEFLEIGAGQTLTRMLRALRSHRGDPS